MAAPGPRVPPRPSTSERTPIPEPYNRSSRSVCKQLRQIHKACGQWPWDLLPGRVPDELDAEMLKQLGAAVKFASDDQYDVTVSEMAEWLKDQIKDGGVLTSKHCFDAVEWVMYIHDERTDYKENYTNNRKAIHVERVKHDERQSGRKSATDGEHGSGRRSSRIRKRQHSNDEVTLPPSLRPTPQSRQKKRSPRTRTSTAKTAAEAEAQPEPEPEPKYEPRPESESESESESGSEAEAEPEPEQDHDMEMDVDSDPNGNAGANITTHRSLIGTSYETLDEAIAASSRRLEVARLNLKEYEEDLEIEKEALDAINASLSDASQAHEAAIQNWRNAVMKTDTKQNELKQIQDFAQSFSPDTQAAFTQEMRRLHDQALEEEKQTSNELRTQRREFCILEDKKDAKEGNIKKMSARIRRYQDDIDAEEVKHQRLIAEHYLEVLSNDIIQSFDIADISYARILEIKLERDQRIWYEQRRNN
ncbi:hypothetical protein LCI18_009701 [Fusarium solani-melongenae]|uniref:Uncharacterized protein n=1 Tax=Fusarium solani subsp. cucurbitae TaxID=2747967 RepID=A0ACD3ZD47_FUSSC|nr:hypothetical protein LCI18_009701 [Fusarium solani-melongenae]